MDLKKKKPDSSDDYTYCNPNPEQESDLQQFSFKTQTDKQKKITFQEIRKQYFKHFKTTTNKALHEVRVLSDMGISRIHNRALALDDFFQRTIQNWKTETESFVEFVRREDNSFHEEHMNFLQIIANTLKERPGITSNEGCYLVALWAEFSVAQAIHESGIPLPSDITETFSLKDFQNLQETFQVDERRHLTSNSDQYTFRKRKRNNRTPPDQSHQPTESKHPRISETIEPPNRSEYQVKIEPVNKTSTSIQHSVFTQKDMVVSDPKTTVDSDKPDPTENHSAEQQADNQVDSNDARDEDSIDLSCRESPLSDSDCLLSKALSTSRSEHQQHGASSSFRRLRESMMPTADALNCANSLIELHGRLPVTSILKQKNDHGLESEQLPQDYHAGMGASVSEAVQEIEMCQPAAGQKMESTEKLQPTMGVEHEVSATVEVLDPAIATTSQTSAAPVIVPGQQMSSVQGSEYNPEYPFTIQYQQREKEKDQSIKEISNLASQLQEEISLLNQNLGKNHGIKETDKKGILNKLLSATIVLNSIEVQNE
ncbi:hypothetical protein [Endozoicomonas sp.]|uniref:hypothetical protein n=1 Tax=Endozoicomonas sp. TaxID=1892382 RepID=UPI003AF44F0F